MKKIMVLFLVILSVSVFAQPEVKSMDFSFGKIWSDSLHTWHDSTGSSWYRASDSVDVLNVEYGSSFVGGIVKDSGTTYTDTLKFYKGVVRFSGSFPYTRVDTLWSDNALAIKINNWEVDTILVLGGKTKHFLLLEQNIFLLKIVRLTTDGYGIGAGLRTEYVIEAIKW